MSPTTGASVWDQDPLRVLIIRTSALGDIVHGFPVLTALRKARPRATIAWLVESHFAPLVAGHGDLDRVIPVQTKRWSKDRSTVFKDAQALRKTFREFNPTVVLDLMSNHKAAALARLTGSAVRIGLAKPYRREPSSALWINQPVEPLGRHAIPRSLSVLRGLGNPDLLADVDFAPDRLHPNATAPIELPQGAFGILHPGAGWRNKELPPALWGEVARLVSEGSGLEMLIVTGPGEEALGEAVAAASQGSATHLPVPELPSLVATQRRAQMVLGGDTGPIHLAHALGTPVLCVMGPTDPELHGPFDSPESVVVRRLPCSFCHKRLDGPRACLLTLSPAQIASAALKRL